VRSRRARPNIVLIRIRLDHPRAAFDVATRAVRLVDSPAPPNGSCSKLDFDPFRFHMADIDPWPNDWAASPLARTFQTPIQNREDRDRGRITDAFGRPHTCNAN
jgi:hypothetical protein